MVFVLFCFFHRPKEKKLLCKAMANQELAKLWNQSVGLGQWRSRTDEADGSEAGGVSGC